MLRLQFLHLALQIPRLIPVRQFLLVGVLGRVALLERFLLALEPGDVGFGGGDALQIIGHDPADQLVTEGIERRAGGFIVLHRVGDGVHPAVDHARKTVFQHVLKSGKVSVHQVAITPASLKRSSVPSGSSAAPKVSRISARTR